MTAITLTGLAKMRHYAQRDLPERALESNRGLLVWAVGRFGPMLLFCAAACCFCYIMYCDIRKDKESSLQVIRENITVNGQVATALTSLNKTLDRIDRNTEPRRYGRGRDD